MIKKDCIYVCEAVDIEGFDYAFRHFEDFKNVKDTKFHELREAYIKAAKELEDYIKYEEYQNK